jgi:raffinose/stachyose/melibiose transport system substrate-binding protein
MADPTRPLDAEAARTAFEARRNRWAEVRNRLGVMVLGLAVAWGLLHVARHSLVEKAAEARGDRVVIRFAHWQLEGHTVRALNEACAEYMRLHPGVVVEQIDVPERGYESWVKTQVIGRTAPDFIQLRPTSWRNLMNRYFQPLTAFVDQPNPYNLGTDLAGVPWQQTFVDNMEGGWMEELQTQFGIPLSVFTVRIFANRKILEQALGRPLAMDGQGRVQGPRTISELLDWCAKIKAIGVTPIAGSSYTASMFNEKYWAMATRALVDRLDRDFSGDLSDLERYRALLDGRLDLASDPHIRVGNEILFDLSQQFNSGFMSAQRDQSVFLFTRGNAAMIATGSWDAGSLYREIAKDFDMVVFDFPTADPTDPKYGRILCQRSSEVDTKAGFCFGLTKQSEHSEQAIDFMMFLTSRRATGAAQAQMRFPDQRVDNGTLNNAFRWFPAVRGCRPLPELEPFTPDPAGLSGGGFNLHFGGDSELRFKNHSTAFLSELNPSPDHYPAFITGYTKELMQYAGTDIATIQVKSYGSLASSERSLSMVRTRIFRGAGAPPPRDFGILLFNQSERVKGLPTSRRELAELRSRQTAGGAR